MARIYFSNRGGWIRNINMPENFLGGNCKVIEKSLSLVRRIRFSLWAMSTIFLSLVFRGANLTSWPFSSRNRITSQRKFSSARNRIGFNHMTCFSHRSGIMQSSFDMFQSQFWVGIFNNILRGFVVSKHFEHQINHNSGAFKTWFAVANAWIGNNIISYAHVLSITNYNPLSRKGGNDRKGKFNHTFKAAPEDRARGGQEQRIYGRLTCGDFNRESQTSARFGL
jgi:hypothetical protein